MRSITRFDTLCENIFPSRANFLFNKAAVLKAARSTWHCLLAGLVEGAEVVQQARHEVAQVAQLAHQEVAEEEEVGLFPSFKIDFSLTLITLFALR